MLLDDDSGDAARVNNDISHLPKMLLDPSEQLQFPLKTVDILVGIYPGPV